METIITYSQEGQEYPIPPMPSKILLLKEIYRHGYKWREDEEEDVSSYWTTIRKREDTGN
jgi:hypothetical protein